MASPKYGTGSVFLRGSTYWVRFWHEGRIYRESARTESAEEARKYLKRRMGEAATGRGGREPYATVGTLLDLLVEDYASTGKRSIYQAKIRIDKHLRPAFGKLPVGELTTAAVRDYTIRRQKSEAAPGTINRELTLLQRSLKLGKRNTPPLVVRDIIIPKLREDNVRTGFLDPEQYERLLAELPECLRGITVIGYHVGCRRGELEMLRWDQVDWAGQVIRLEGAQTKNGRPRVLPIYDAMGPELQRLYKRRSLGCRWVFEEAGKRLRRHDVDWRLACEAAGIEGLLFHDLRRSAVRNMERAGVPRSVAMAISGHRTESTYRRYDIVNEADIAAAGEKLAEYFGRRPKGKKLVVMKKVKNG